MKATLCVSPSQLLLATHTHDRLHNYWLLLIIARHVYIAHIPMYRYTCVYIVQKWASTAL